MRRNSFYSVMIIALMLLAVVTSGGCGGSSSSINRNNNQEDKESQNTADYSTKIAEKLFEYSEVYNIHDFLMNSSAGVNKGDILLWHKGDSADIILNESNVSRINDAIGKGAIIAFIDVKAEDIDRLTDSCDLYIPAYLTDDATAEEKNAKEDLYAIALRVNPEDRTALNSDDMFLMDSFANFGTNLFGSADQMTITFESGDETYEVDVSDAESDSEMEDAERTYYVDGEIISEDPDPMNYSYVDDAAEDLLEWTESLDELKAYSDIVSEDVTAGGVKVNSAAKEASSVFPGMSYTFTPLLHQEPREYYFTKNNKTLKFKHKAWHRETTLAFNIIPVHSFSDGADYYVFKVTGSTDPSKQYAHLSYMAPYELGLSSIVEGMGTQKPGTLLNDNILGYNNKFQYTAQLMSGKTVVGTLNKFAPETINDKTVKSNGFSFELNGSITGGASQEKGAYGEISVKPTWKWESKETYTVTDYKRASISGARSAGWRWEFQRPRNGSKGFDGVWLEDVPLAGRSSVKLDSEFVIKVEKTEWKKYPKLKLYVNFESWEGGTEGDGIFLRMAKGRRDWDYHWSKDNKSEYTLPRPRHIALRQNRFDFKAAKGNAIAYLMSEEDWTATTNASWIHFTTSDNNTKQVNGFDSVSGKATGAAETQIMISVDESTESKARGGKITFKSSDGDVSVVDIIQLGK